MSWVNNSGLSYFWAKCKAAFAAVGHSHSAASQSAAGYMSASDKAKLDGVATGATANAGTITGITTTSPLSGSGNSGSVALSHANSGVTAGSYGASESVIYPDNENPAAVNFDIPYVTVDEKGHVTNAGANERRAVVSAVNGAAGTLSDAEDAITSLAGKVGNVGNTSLQYQVDTLRDSVSHFSTTCKKVKWQWVTDHLDNEVVLNDGTSRVFVINDSELKYYTKSGDTITKLWTITKDSSVVAVRSFTTAYTAAAGANVQINFNPSLNGYTPIGFVGFTTADPNVLVQQFRNVGGGTYRCYVKNTGTTTASREAIADILFVRNV